MIKDIMFTASGVLLIVGGWELHQLGKDLLDLSGSGDIAVYAWQQIGYMILLVSGIALLQHKEFK